MNSMDGGDRLEQLLRTYFNQDWRMEASSGRELLELFVQENPPEIIESTRQGVQELLAQRLSESELAAELDASGLEYAPRAEGMTHHQWLEQVLGVLEEASSDD